MRRRPLELVVAATSVALAVALVASLGTFFTQSRAQLTLRAAASVPVDWQVQVTPQGRERAVAARLAAQVPDVRATERVSYAKVRALESTVQGNARLTGTAYVVSMPSSYTATFPGEVRHLVGKHAGVLLLQQTAANLAAAPGDVFSVQTARTRRTLSVDGVVEMPAADSFFQVVGLAPGAGVSAPPDNVVLVPPSMFRSVVGSTSVVEQLHVGFRHDGLPADPQKAALLIQGRMNHLQAAVAGGALIGDNLGTALTAAGEDARYAELLFLLLGLPALTLAIVVAALVMSLRSDRRRRELALLRLRGASSPAILRIICSEAILTALLGVLLGIPMAWVVIHFALPAETPLSAGWTWAAGLGGLFLALGIQSAGVFKLIAGRGRPAVAAEAAGGPRTASPWPLRAGLDVVLLLAAGLAFALTASGGYQVVLAPEGVPTTQVNYAALAGPAFAWPGLALLVWRLTAWAMKRRTGRWSRARDGAAPELEAAAVRRRRRVIARGAAGLAVSLGLVMSTAVFASTYRAQARVDVALTVGSDVAVVEPSGGSVGPSEASALARARGVRAVEPLQHRFAYVGPDLQDIYGVRASTFSRVAPLQDTFMPGSTVAATLRKLERTPDGVLLSAETLHDYQLHAGDLIRMRLQTGKDQAYRAVPFHVIGQVNEWPTAPKDSFIVANADYLAKTTGSDAVGSFLVSSSSPAATASSLRSMLSGSGAQVHDTTSEDAHVTSASGLAATDLTGLSRIELGFGALMALACSGLALLGGIIERRRALVLLAALGASARQRGRFLTAEAEGLVIWGVAGGIAIGAVISFMLVKVLTGIFDPPPAAASVPWPFLATLLSAVGGVTAAVVALFGRLAARAGPAELRDL
jgi:putative ABC transport system permease protein